MRDSQTLSSPILKRYNTPMTQTPKNTNDLLKWHGPLHIPNFEQNPRHQVPDSKIIKISENEFKNPNKTETNQNRSVQASL